MQFSDHPHYFINFNSSGLAFFLKFQNFATLKLKLRNLTPDTINKAKELKPPQKIILIMPMLLKRPDTWILKKHRWKVKVIRRNSLKKKIRCTKTLVFHPRTNLAAVHPIGEGAYVSEIVNGLIITELILIWTLDFNSSKNVGQTSSFWCAGSVIIIIIEKREEHPKAVKIVRDPTVSHGKDRSTGTPWSWVIYVVLW